MLKMYQSGGHDGGEPELWEANWETSDFERSLSFCQVDPLFPLFEKYALPGVTMLEGGCGVGQYVAFHASRGVNIIGLDFASKTIRRLKAQIPGLKLCVGDVASLPFCDCTFDLYYSGGVVEHFEEGPERAVMEARRVLKPGGTLLISVPYLSLLRRLLLTSKSRSWKKVSKASIDSEWNGMRFFQYVYSRKEFEAILARAGLRVIGTQGYGILWGLYDVARLQTLITKLSGGQNSSVPEPSRVNSRTSGTGTRCEDVSSASTRSVPSESYVRAIIKRIVVSEDDRFPVAGLGVKLMRLVCANMMMYVCVRAQTIVKRNFEDE